MRTFRILVVEFVLTIIGIILLGKLPYLFFNMKQLTGVQKLLDTGILNNAEYLSYFFEFNWGRYFSQVLETGSQIIHLGTLDYYSAGEYDPLFPIMWVKFIYSMKILTGGILLSVILAVIITYFIMLSSSKVVRKVSQAVTSVLQIIPDVFLIIALQVLFVYIYRKTGVLVFNVRVSFGEEAYALPIICLAILPAVFLVKTLSIIYEEELEKRYVETAMAKGIRRSRILINHIFRNALISLFHNFKMLFWFVLSNLLMLEVLFDMDGFISFMWRAGSINPHIFTIGLLMIFMPFYMVFVLSGIVINKVTSDTKGVFG